MSKGDLTLREAAVIRGWSLGWTNRRIAQALDVSPFTVQEWGRHIRNKLGAHSRAEAVAIWLKAARPV